MLLEKVLGALLPAIITILIGYFAARHHDFSQDEVPTLSRMVMGYAFPLSLFVGVMSAGRKELLADLPLAAFLVGAMVGMYALVLLIAVFAFRNPIGLSALRALTAAAPSTAFVGTPVMGYLYGTTGDIPIAIGSIIIVLFLVPATLILLALDPQTADISAGEAGRSGAVQNANIGEKILQSLKQPVVWLPFLGFVLVALNVDLPGFLDNSLSLLGQASAGVALFTSGIIPRRLSGDLKRSGHGSRVFKECGAAGSRLSWHALAGFRQSAPGSDSHDNSAAGCDARRHARRAISHRNPGDGVGAFDQHVRLAADHERFHLAGVVRA